MKRPQASEALGLVTPMTPVLVTGVLLYFSAMPGLMSGGVSPARLMANTSLFAVLVAACVLWHGVHHLRRLPTYTATGFGAAALGLAARVVADLVVWRFDLACYPYRPGGVLGARLETLVTLCRVGGLVAYVFGLAMVVATSLREARPTA